MPTGRRCLLADKTMHQLFHATPSSAIICVNIVLLIAPSMFPPRRFCQFACTRPAATKFLDYITFRVYQIETISPTFHFTVEGCLVTFGYTSETNSSTHYALSRAVALILTPGLRRKLQIFTDLLVATTEQPTRAVLRCS